MGGQSKSSRINKLYVKYEQDEAVLTAARADLSPAHDGANIAVKYEDLKQTQLFRLTSKNKH